MLFYLLGVSRITKPEKSWKFKSVPPRSQWIPTLLPMCNDTYVHVICNYICTYLHTFCNTFIPLRITLLIKLYIYLVQITNVVSLNHGPAAILVTALLAALVCHKSRFSSSSSLAHN